MSFITLLHNPDAGSSRVTKEQLVSLISSAGYRCRYLSTRENSHDFLDPDAEILVVAGGDGTVRKVIRQVLVHQASGRSWPIAILPLGTANNIAHTLGIEGTLEEIVNGWKDWREKNYDVGGISGLQEGSFFLEAFGFGLFPHVMRRMQEKENGHKKNKDSVHQAVRLLHRRLSAYKEKTCFVEVDGKDHSGKYFLVEVMNSSFIGPNLLLSSHSDPGDGKLEIVLLGKKDKEIFEEYLVKRLRHDGNDFPFPALKGSEVRLSWHGKLTHLDDVCFKLNKGTQVSIRILPGTLQFLVP